MSFPRGDDVAGNPFADAPGMLAPDDPRVAGYWGVSRPPQGPPEPLASVQPPAEPVSSSAAAPAPDDKVASYWGAAPAPPEPDAFSPQNMPLAFGKSPARPPSPPTAPATGAPPGALTAADFAQGFGAPKKPGGAPPTLSGPTAEDDAAFEAFKAGLEKKKAPAGGGATPAPSTTMRDLLGTYDTAAEATGRGARAEQTKALEQADARAQLAREQQEDGALARAEAEEAQRHYEEQISKVQDQVDALKAKKIDPLRGMHDTGFQILAVVGGALGGVYQGLNHLQSNPFIDNLNKTIDRSVSLQEKELDREKEGVGQTMSLLGQQRAAFKDMTLAKLQARNLYYEATKQEIEAQAARSDVPVMQARADLAVNGIKQQQLLLKKQIEDQARAQAAAAAAHARALAKEMSDNYKDLWDKAIASGMTPEQAEVEANRQLGRMYGQNPGARPPSAQSSDDAPLTKEGRERQHEALAEVRGALRSIDGFAPKRVASGSSLNARTPDLVNSSEGKAENEERDRYNSGVRQWVGSAWRLTTNGMEPKNQEILEEQAKPFLALPTDNAEDILRKQQNLKNHLTNAAASHGLSVSSGRPTVQRFDANGKPIL